MVGEEAHANGVKVEDVKVKMEVKMETRSEPVSVSTPTRIKPEEDPFWASLKEGSRSPSPSAPSARFGSVDVKDSSRPPYSRAGSASGASTPRGSKSNGAAGRGKKETAPIQRPLIDDLPLAWDAAHETFDVLEACVYETKKMGLSREEDEMMVCDCAFDKRTSRSDTLPWCEA